MKSNLKRVLAIIAETLNNNSIKWVVGGSIVLNQYNIVKEVNDIDLIIDKFDFDKAVTLLKQIGNEKSIVDKLNYHTKKFTKMKVEEVSIDLMSDFIIEHDVGLYKYILDHEAIASYMVISGTSVPLGALEDWYVIYQVIGGRERKVNLINDYLSNHGVTSKNLLKRALNQTLPETVIDNINRLLNT